MGITEDGYNDSVEILTSVNTNQLSPISKIIAVMESILAGIVPFVYCPRVTPQGTERQ